MTSDPAVGFLAFQERRQKSPRKPSPWIDRLGRNTALWLAAVPQWTVALAEQARMPLATGIGSVEDLVQFAYIAGVATQRKEPAPGGGDIELFWVDEVTRRTWITDLTAQIDNLSGQVAEIAASVQAASGGRAVVPALTRRWLDLVHSESGRSGEKLFKDIAGLVTRDELVEAGVLTDAAAALAPVRGGTYPAAVSRARRLLQAGYRRRRDREVLADFVPRDDLIAPLTELIRSDREDPWALHLLGAGGVGKTMLLRYLASNRFARENDLSPFTVARVDFDRITADYPVDRPVELLTELADDVIVAADADIPELLLRRFFASVESVNAAAADSPLSLRDPLVTGTVKLFAEYLSMLPAPQVLVLDTCEELAKLHPAGAEVPPITRTFELLMDVRATCDTIRVVFAGRRYLARSGRDWTCPKGVSQRAVVSLADRDYLRLEYVRGFSGSDAGKLLRRPHPDTGLVPADAFVEAVLDRSPEVGSEAHPPDPDRYNPFMVAHFRSWWEDEPDTTPQALTEAGPDVYVAGRIVSRLHDRDLEDLLPTLAWLGRLDEVMLADAMAEPPYSERVSRVIEVLAEQEWTEITIDSATDMRVLAVSEGLLPLLREWAHRPEQLPRLTAARDRLGRSLRERLEQASLSTLTAELIAAALREYAPGLSALAWAGIEERVERESRWNWAGNILSRVQAELEADLVDDPLLNAALTATALAAQWRYRPVADMSAAWTLVQGLLAQAGPAEADAWRARLTARATLGQRRAEPASRDLIHGLLDQLARRDAAPLVSAVAALESVLSPVPSAARIEFGLSAEAERTAAVLAGTVAEDPAVVVGGLVALATLVPYDKRATIMLWADGRSVAADLKEAGHRAPAWADRPLFDGRDPRLWLALHRAAAALATGHAVDEPTLAGWEELAGRHLTGSVDADRLAGCREELSAQLRTGADGGSSRGTGMWWYDPDLRASDAIHDETPPRVVALARSLYRAGRPADAERILDSWRQKALDNRTEDATIRMADESLAWLAIRMRREDYRPTAMAALTSLPGPGSALARTLRLLVDGDSESSATDLAVQLTSVVPRWLGQDIALELALASAQVPPVAAVRNRIGELRDSDPLTACQLATALALRQRRDTAGTEPETVSLVRDLYGEIPAAAELPTWGSVGLAVDPTDPWSGWRARWSLLDGSISARSASRGLLSPELRSSGSPRKAVSGEAQNRLTTGRLVISTAVWTIIAITVAVVFGLNHTNLLAQILFALASGAVAAVAAILTVIAIPGNRVARLRRWLIRNAVLAVTVLPDLPLEVIAEQWLCDGWLISGLFRRDSSIAVHRSFPRVLRRSGPAPGADGHPVEPPLPADILATWPFDRVPALLDLEASGSSSDWEHDLIDAREDQSWRCVWVRDRVRGKVLSWPGPGVALSVPEEWASGLRDAYQIGIDLTKKPMRQGFVEVEGMARIEHRMGLPVDTRSGPVLQITQSDDLRTGREQSYSPSYSSGSSGPGTPAWLTVVQVTPADGPFHRDPSTADLTRRLVLAVQRESTGWVLALPALPPAVATEAWQVLGRLAQRNRTRRWHLVSCVAEIKRAVVDSPLPGDRRQVAQDVLLIGPWWAS